MRIRHLLFAAACLSLAGCSTHERTDAASVSLSERQRDSVLSRSALPGAGTVGRALDQSDRAARRAAAMDSLTH